MIFRFFSWNIFLVIIINTMSMAKSIFIMPIVSNIDSRLLLSDLCKDYGRLYASSIEIDGIMFSFPFAFIAFIYLYILSFM